MQPHGSPHAARESVHPANLLSGVLIEAICLQYLSLPPCPVCSFNCLFAFLVSHVVFFSSTNFRKGHNSTQRLHDTLTVKAFGEFLKQHVETRQLWEHMFHPLCPLQFQVSALCVAMPPHAGHEMRGCDPHTWLGWMVTVYTKHNSPSPSRMQG